jgi:hypothetical protein
MPRARSAAIRPARPPSRRCTVAGGTAASRPTQCTPNSRSATACFGPMPCRASTGSGPSQSTTWSGSTARTPPGASIWPEAVAATVIVGPIPTRTSTPRRERVRTRSTSPKYRALGAVVAKGTSQLHQGRRRGQRLNDRGKLREQFQDLPEDVLRQPVRAAHMHHTRHPLISRHPCPSLRRHGTHLHYTHHIELVFEHARDAAPQSKIPGTDHAGRPAP